MIAGYTVFKRRVFIEIKCISLSAVILLANKNILVLVTDVTKSFVN